jgi:uncharacterized iron-regulated membrane protein
LRKAFFLIHLYVGLTFGLLASVIGLTGSLMVFRHELDPPLPARAPAPDVCSPQKWVERARSSFPSHTAQTLNYPADPAGSIEVWFKDDPMRAYIDPGTGELLGSRNEDETFFGRLFKLHTEFLSGDKGHTLAGLTGIGLIVMCLSGLVVWWPRKNQKVRDHLRVKCKAGFKRANYDLHRAAGFFACFFLLLIATTGVALAFPDPAQALFFRVAGKPKPPAKPKASKAEKQLPLDELVSVAQEEIPDAKVRRIVLPIKPGDPLLVRLKRPGELHPNGMNYVYLDPSNGRVLRIDRDSGGHLGQQAMNMRYPLHTGIWAGTLSRVLQCVVGLTPTLLMVTGTIMWWKRRKRVTKPKAA